MERGVDNAVIAVDVLMHPHNVVDLHLLPACILQVSISFHTPRPAPLR